MIDEERVSAEKTAVPFLLRDGLFIDHRDQHPETV